MSARPHPKLMISMFRASLGMSEMFCGAGLSIVFRSPFPQNFIWVGMFSVVSGWGSSRNLGAGLSSVAGWTLHPVSVRRVSPRREMIRFFMMND